MPPPNKVYGSPEEAVADVQDGASILMAGYGEPGTPQRLIRALAAKGVSGLTCISGPWYGRNPALYDVPRLVNGGQVARAITPTPLYHDTLGPILEMWKSGKLELDIVAPGFWRSASGPAAPAWAGHICPTKKNTIAWSPQPLTAPGTHCTRP